MTSTSKAVTRVWVLTSIFTILAERKALQGNGRSYTGKGGGKVNQRFWRKERPWLELWLRKLPGRADPWWTDRGETPEAEEPVWGVLGQCRQQGPWQQAEERVDPRKLWKERRDKRLGLELAGFHEWHLDQTCLEQWDMMVKMRNRLSEIQNQRIRTS